MKLGQDNNFPFPLFIFPVKRKRKMNSAFSNHGHDHDFDYINPYRLTFSYGFTPPTLPI